MIDTVMVLDRNRNGCYSIYKILYNTKKEPPRYSCREISNHTH